MLFQNLLLILPRGQLQRLALCHRLILYTTLKLKKQDNYSIANNNSTELIVIEIIGVIGTCIVAGIKLAASYATGGMIPAW